MPAVGAVLHCDRRRVVAEPLQPHRGLDRQAAGDRRGRTVRDGHLVGTCERQPASRDLAATPEWPGCRVHAADDRHARGRADGVERERTRHSGHPVGRAALHQQGVGAGQRQRRQVGMAGVADGTGDLVSQRVEQPQRHVAAGGQRKAVEQQRVPCRPGEAERLRGKACRQTEVHPRAERDRGGGRQVEQAEPEAADAAVRRRDLDGIGARADGDQRIARELVAVGVADVARQAQPAGPGQREVEAGVVRQPVDHQRRGRRQGEGVGVGLERCRRPGFRHVPEAVIAVHQRAIRAG